MEARELETAWDANCASTWTWSASMMQPVPVLSEAKNSAVRIFEHPVHGFPPTKNSDWGSAFQVGDGNKKILKTT